MGGRAEYVKIMIDSGNTVGDLVSEEFAGRLGLEGDEVWDHMAVPTAATSTTILVVKQCREITARLAGIVGEFTVWLLVVRGLLLGVGEPEPEPGSWTVLRLGRRV